VLIIVACSSRLKSSNSRKKSTNKIKNQLQYYARMDTGGVAATCRASHHNLLLVSQRNTNAHCALKSITQQVSQGKKKASWQSAFIYHVSGIHSGAHAYHVYALPQQHCQKPQLEEGQTACLHCITE
jgi:hypothetical protein